MNRKQVVSQGVCCWGGGLERDDFPVSLLIRYNCPSSNKKTRSVPPPTHTKAFHGMRRTIIRVTLPTVRVATTLFHVFLPTCTDAQYQPLPHTLPSCVCSASCVSPGLLIDKASKYMPKEIFQRKVSWHKLGLWHISVWRADWPSEPAADCCPPTVASASGLCPPASSHSNAWFGPYLKSTALFLGMQREGMLKIKLIHRMEIPDPVQTDLGAHG